MRERRQYAEPEVGVTAGIDFVLALIAELGGGGGLWRHVAEMVQLAWNTRRNLPFTSGLPDTAAAAKYLESVNRA